LVNLGEKEFTRGDRLLSPTSFKVIVPEHFDNPLRRGLVFIIDELSQLKDTKAYDNCDRKRYEAVKKVRKNWVKTDPTMLLPMKMQHDIYVRGISESTIFKHIHGIPELISSYAADATPMCTPVAYFEMQESFHGKHSFKIDYPRSGKFILVKFIDARQKNQNDHVPRTIDVQHIAFYA